MGMPTFDYQADFDGAVPKIRGKIFGSKLAGEQGEGRAQDRAEHFA
jgi:hypothetical protein